MIVNRSLPASRHILYILDQFVMPFEPYTKQKLSLMQDNDKLQMNKVVKNYFEEDKVVNDRILVVENKVKTIQDQ